MSIFSRTRDIFAANITEILDRSEDPAKMIRMVILEMEETLVEVRASAARCIADGKEMRRALSRLDELQKSWTEKAELALSKEREDLAESQKNSEIIPRRDRPAKKPETEFKDRQLVIEQDGVRSGVRASRMRTSPSVLRGNGIR